MERSCFWQTIHFFDWRWYITCVEKKKSLHQSTLWQIQCSASCMTVVDVNLTLPLTWREECDSLLRVLCKGDMVTYVCWDLVLLYPRQWGLGQSASWFWMERSFGKGSCPARRSLRRRGGWGSDTKCQSLSAVLQLALVVFLLLIRQLPLRLWRFSLLLCFVNVFLPRFAGLWEMHLKCRDDVSCRPNLGLAFSITYLAFLHFQFYAILIQGVK